MISNESRATVAYISIFLVQCATFSVILTWKALTWALERNIENILKFVSSAALYIFRLSRHFSIRGKEDTKIYCSLLYSTMLHDLKTPKFAFAFKRYQMKEASALLKWNFVSEKSNLKVLQRIQQ